MYQAAKLHNSNIMGFDMGFISMIFLELEFAWVFSATPFVDIIFLLCCFF
jgi:hypothetical protein